jgi:hypothetical protein
MIADQKKAVFFILRLAVAMCFIGHGAFGIITKPVWCNYFAVVGIGNALAYQLMPIVGAIDVVLGILMLLYPVRAIPAWLVIWGLLTALFRPLAGEPVAEFIERAGNFGAPLCLLLLSGIPHNARGWVTRMSAADGVSISTANLVSGCLRIVVCLLLAGHGWLNMIEKAALIKQYTALGFSNPAGVASLVGAVEIAAALLVLIKPLRPVLLVLFCWKMATELLYPNYAMFEWIERAGSYGSLLALYILTPKQMRVHITGSDTENIGHPNTRFQKLRSLVAPTSSP